MPIEQCGKTRPQKHGSRNPSEPYKPTSKSNYFQNNSAGPPIQDIQTPTNENNAITNKKLTRTPRPDHQPPDPSEPRPTPRSKQELQSHDPDEQHWLDLEKQELRKRERKIPKTRNGFLLPNDTDTLIYHEKRGEPRGRTGGNQMVWWRTYKNNCPK